ncbi:MAG TPA: SdrD B-like domain-containing protein [Anaerolineales bacterium]|nr:SdrD B-like domain-containing protein [Anaerolineales bacterium]
MTKIKPNASSPRLSILLLSILFAGLYLFTSAQVGGAAPLDAVTGYSLPVSAMTKIFASDGKEYDKFGDSIAIDGDTMVVASSEFDTSTSLGSSAYVYVKTPTGWVEQAKLTVTNSTDLYGSINSVAISSDTIILGTPDAMNAGISTGGAYVFVRSGTIWSEEAQLFPSDGQEFDLFGSSVAIEGDDVLVGSRYADDVINGLFDTGAVYAFRRSAGAWTEVQRFIHPSADSTDVFGRSVAISSGKAVIGAIRGDGTTANTGTAYIYELVSGTWNYQATLISSDGVANRDFGISVDIDGDDVVIGALSQPGLDDKTGAAYIFQNSAGVWSQVAKLMAVDGKYNDLFGVSVAISSGHVWVGADNHSDYEGAVYEFVNDGSNWTQIVKWQEPIPNIQRYFGKSVAASGLNFAVGAISGNGLESRSGIAYVVEHRPIRYQLWWDLNADGLTAGESDYTDQYDILPYITDSTRLLSRYTGDPYGFGLLPTSFDFGIRLPIAASWTADAVSDGIVPVDAFSNDIYDFGIVPWADETHIAGVVYDDFDEDGQFDFSNALSDRYEPEVGLAGITISAYDSMGNLVATTISDANGMYQLDMSGNSESLFRLEFTKLPAGYQPSVNGVQNGTSVVFVSKNTNVNFGVFQPSNYYGKVKMVTARTENEPDELLRYNYMAISSPETVVPSSIIALQADTGNTYGLAWQSASDTLFAGAYFGGYGTTYGSAGSSGIYKIENAYDTQTPVSSLFVDLSVLGVDAGPNIISDPCVIAGTGNSAAVGCYHDVGSRGLGDLELSKDGNTLYTINLYTDQLVSVVLGTPPIVPVTATSIDVPRPANCPTAEDFVPMAIGVAPDTGFVYIGATCNARSTQSVTELRGYIFEWNPSISFPASPIVDFQLNYPRMVWNRAGIWRPWQETSQTVPTHSSPLISDIAFHNGDLIFSVSDILGSITPERQPSAVGDLLRACNSAGVWSIENNGVCGTLPANPQGADNADGVGNGEYYWDDEGEEDDITNSGISTLPNYRHVAVTGVDIQAHNGRQGVAYIDRNTGQQSNYVSDLFISSDGPYKTTAMGDLEPMWQTPAIQVGSRIWNDDNANGIQDPGELGIAGMIVELYDGTTKIGEAITDSGGNYFFGGLAQQNMLDSGTTKTISQEILNNYDDVDELVSNGIISINRSYLPMPYTFGEEETIVGLRFIQLDIPAQSTITNAYMEFVADDNSYMPVSLKIQALAQDSATYFNGKFYELSSQPTTASVANWSVPIASYGSVQQTSDLSSIVQEIVDRSGWQNGNNMTFVVRNDGTASPNAFYSNSFRSDAKPKLFVTYNEKYAISPNANLSIRIPNAGGGSQQPPLSGMKLTTINAPQPANAGASATTNNPITDVADSDANMLGDTAIISFTTGAAGENNHGLDFGFALPRTSALGNYVWVDEDSDGYQDEGEPGIPNVSVTATWAGADNTFGTADDGVLTTVTDSAGGYLFSHLPAGQYAVKVDASTLPAGMTQTTTYPSAGNDEYNQNQSGTGYLVTLAVNQTNLTADFGYNYNPTNEVNPPGIVPPAGGSQAALGDRVWVDVNGDGVQDSNEIGVSGVVVTLYNDADGNGVYDTVVATDTTDANGYYLFDNLPAGGYVVRVTDSASASHDVLATYTQTGDPDHFGTAIPASDPLNLASDNASTLPIILAPGDVFLNADFGYRPSKSELLGKIGDYVWLDADADGVQDAAESPIRNVSVALIKDSNGNGVWEAGEPILASAVTDASGYYLFDALPITDGAGTDDYLVWVNDTNNALNGLAQTYDADGVGIPNAQVSFVLGLSHVTDLTDTPVLNQDFGYTLDNSGQHGPTGGGSGSNPGIIGDTIWLDTNGDGIQNNGESGIPGVVVQLSLPDNSTQTAITGADGHYLFTNLPADADGEAYSVTVLPSNFNPGGALEGMNNTGDPQGDNNNTSDTSLSDATPVDLVQDFGYNGKGEIGNLVWNDINTNGIYEPNGADGVAGTADDELPIAGVTVDLYKDLNGNGKLDAGEPLVTSTVTGNTLTPSAGNYLFSGLGYGSYVVDVSDRAGVLAGYWHSMGSSAIDNHSQADPYGVAISSGSPQNLTADFGYYKLGGSIGNRVWFDSDGDGRQDVGEKGVNGIKVSLTIDYKNGDTSVLSMLTRNDPVTGEAGWYNFSNLLMDENHNGAGTADATYTVTVDLDPFTATKTDAVAGNDMLDSDNALGVVAQPLKGRVSLTALNGGAADIEEAPIASYDFGVVAADWGDLPEMYNTRVTSNGPRHMLAPQFNADGTLNLAAMQPSFWLGAVQPDVTIDGQPGLFANGDGADEDGVVADTVDWNTDTQNGGTPGGSVTIIVGGTGGYVVGWFDFNGDGVFDSYLAQQLSAGVHTVPVSVPDGAFDPNGTTGGSGRTVYARFRIYADQATAETQMGGAASKTLGYNGVAVDGEVEDYAWGFGPTAVSLSAMGIVQPAVVQWAVLVVTLILLATAGWWLSIRHKYDALK